MSELRAQCLDCGCEDFWVEWRPGYMAFSITCEGCGASSSSHPPLPVSRKRAANGTFDRTAYMREYMRLRRKERPDGKM